MERRLPFAVFSDTYEAKTKLRSTTSTLGVLHQIAENDPHEH